MTEPPKHDNMKHKSPTVSELPVHNSLNYKISSPVRQNYICIIQQELHIKWRLACIICTCKNVQGAGIAQLVSIYLP